MNLFNEISQFNKLLNSASGNDVLNWDSDHLNIVIQHAHAIETKLFELSRKDAKLVQRQLVKKKFGDVDDITIIRKPPPSLKELKNARYLLYKTLLSNPKLSNSLYSYLLRKRQEFNNNNNERSAS